MSEKKGDIQHVGRMQITFELLEQVLRLPSDVKITCADSSDAAPGCVAFEVEGKSVPPSMIGKAIPSVRPVFERPRPPRFLRFERIDDEQEKVS